MSVSKNRILTRAELTDVVWGEHAEVQKLFKEHFGDEIEHRRYEAWWPVWPPPRDKASCRDRAWGALSAPALHGASKVRRFSKML